MSSKGNNSSVLPRGFKPVKYNKLKERLDNLSPAQQEVRSLMVRDEKIRTAKDFQTATNPPYSKLKKISDINSNNIEAARSLRELTPFIRRAEQIWLTLLLRPNGANKQGLLTYRTEDSELKNDELHQMLLTRCKNHFTSIYPFENRLSKIIKDVMFRTGSYILVNISHPALDHMINGMDITGNENLLEINKLERFIIDQEFEGGIKGKVRNTGWISKRATTESLSGFENMFRSKSKSKNGTEFNLLDDFFKWSFTDNPIVLKLNELKNKINSKTIFSTSGLENMSGLVEHVFTKDKNHKTSPNNIGITEKEAYEKLLDRAYPTRKYDKNESASIRKSQYYSASGHGKAIVDHPPSESCIPVHLNGNVDGEPIGFIFLLDDENGMYLQSTSDASFYSSGKNRGSKIDTQPRSGSMNAIISDLKNFAQGKSCEYDMDWVIDYVTANLEKEIIESFANGVKGTKVTVSLTDEQKRIYMGRALKQQGVRSVFIPAEYVTYFAIDYTRLGLGQSLVAEAKTIITRNALLDIADTAAQIENAVSKTELRITPEAEDFEPISTAYQVRENYLQTNPSMIDVVGFSSRPIDQAIDGVKNTLVQTVIEAGDNRRVIAPGVEVRPVENGGLQGIDSDTRDNGKNAVASFFDLKVSWLEDTENGNEFAIEALNDQQLLKDTAIERSNIFSMHCTDHLRKYIISNEPLMLELIELIKDNKKLYEKPDQDNEIWKEYENEVQNESQKVLLVLNDFLKSFRVSLPTINTIESYNKMSDKIEAVKKMVETWIETGAPETLFKNAMAMVGIEQKIEDTENFGVENMLDTIKAIMTREACKMVGVPLPFDDIINEGTSGGIMQFVNQATAQQSNIVNFIVSYVEAFAKNNKEFKETVKTLEKSLKLLNENEPEETSSNTFDPSPGNDEFTNDNGAEEDQDDTGESGNDETTDESDSEENNNAESAENDLNKGLEF